MPPAEPERYRLDVRDEVLDDLRERLSRTRWPDEIPGSGWRYGSSLGFMHRLIERWRDGFDWRAQEARLNAFDQFRVPIEGIDSTWSTSEASARTPCRSCSSTAGRDRCGSSTSSSPGSPIPPGSAAMADLFAALVTDVLGYPRFAAQGGDWGGHVVARLGSAHRERLLGIHLNFLPLPLDLPFPAQMTDEHRAYQEEVRRWQREETGYSLIQGTKPQTLAYALTDSPAGLAAWIAEKFHTWTDHDGDLERAVDLDSLLTNITLYWVTGAINSSFWPYDAVRHEPWPVPRTRVETPTAHASFPREIRHPPRSLAEQAFNIQRWTEMPRGGHFAALEAPELLAADVAAFFRSLRAPQCPH